MKWSGDPNSGMVVISNIGGFQIWPALNNRSFLDDAYMLHPTFRTPEWALFTIFSDPN
jgi:hypothetical protein